MISTRHLLCAVLTVLSLLATLTTITTGADQSSTKPDNLYSFSSVVHFDDNYKPKYNGTVIKRTELNLTDKAKSVLPELDYYEPGEGPDDYDSNENLKPQLGSSTPKVENSAIKPTSQPAVSSDSDSATPNSGFKPNVYVHSDTVKFENNFAPKYSGEVIVRRKLNLTDKAKSVLPTRDYYDAGEGPEDDDISDDYLFNPSSSTMAPKVETSSAKPSTIDSKDRENSKYDPNIALKPNVYVHSESVKFDKDFSPKYKGEVINRRKLKLTNKAKKVVPEMDYYDPGEGPEDDDDDYELPGEDGVNSKKAISTSTTTTTSTPTEKPNSGDSKIISFSEMVKFDANFKPKYKGVVINRRKLNLTDKAKKVSISFDYYEPGEGPQDDEDDDYILEPSKEPSKPTQTVSRPSKPSTSTVRTVQVKYADSYEVDDRELEDIDLAVGGISGVVQKIIQGPKHKEIDENSSPEEVYVYLSNIVRDESGKAFKATLPRIYDYQFPIGNLVSQRCFNSFAQFGDRLRKGYTWPMKMLSSSSSLSFNNFALRQYGDFDRCLRIQADDNERRPTEVFFSGQYCMMQVQLPLPGLKANLTYEDKVLHFNETELDGTFGEFISLNAPFMYSNPLSLALCVPSTCLPSEIEDVIHFFLHKYHIKAQMGVDCYSKINMTVTALPGELNDMNMSIIEQRMSSSFADRYRALSSTQVSAIVLILVSCLLVVLATLVEIRQIHSNDGRQWSSTERNRPKSFLACFSARYNLEQVYNVRDRHMYEMPVSSSDNVEHDIELVSKNFRQGCNHRANTASLDGLKIFALVWICLANFYFLGYQPQMLSSVANLREIVLSLKHSAPAQLITQSWITMEIFFLISGFLLAYTALPFIVRHDGRPNLSFLVAKRIIRFLPSIIFLLLAVSLLPLWKNAGPLYNSGVEKIVQPCKRFYWRNLFFTTNFYSYDQVCLPHFWYLSVEFQLSIIGIFVTTFAYNRPKHALVAFMLLGLIGLVTPAYFAVAKKLGIVLPFLERAVLEEIPNVIKDLYFNPPVHFVAYFIGLALGYYSRINQSRPLIVAKPLRILLWLVLPPLCVLAVYTPCWWPFKPSFRYTNAFTTLYYATYRLAFVALFAWILHQCTHFRSGISRICSAPFFKLFSALSYQIYLLNLIVIWIYLFTRRTVIEDSLIETISVAVSLFLFTVVLALATYLLFEAPYRSLFRYYFESPRILNPVLTVSQIMNGKSNSSGDYSKELKLNPNFLFSPHYNLITNNSSRAESEAGSVANFPVAPMSASKEPKLNGQLPKTYSSISMAPSLNESENDFNNNNTNVTLVIGSSTIDTTGTDGKGGNVQHQTPVIGETY